MVDAVCVVESIGDPKKIVSGAIRFNDNPRDLLIAQNAVKVIVNSGYFKMVLFIKQERLEPHLLFTKLLREEMLSKNIKASLGFRRNNFSTCKITRRINGCSF